MSGEEPAPRAGVDRDSSPFWRAVDEGRLELQRCTGCGVLRWPPRAVCNRCFDFDAEWVAVSGRGRVVGWIRTHQVFASAWQDEVPYVVVQVALEEQPDILMIGGWGEERSPAAGELVEARFVEDRAGAKRVDWAPAG